MLEIIFFILLIYLFSLLVMAVYIGSRGGRATDAILLVVLEVLVRLFGR